jgi:uncharacterized protein YcbK (DUF882 family)
VARIADFYGVSQRDLREINNLREGAPLRIGQKLRIPNVLRLSGKKYRVQEGDSLASIADKFKCSVQDLAVANKIGKDTVLQVGRVLVIPDESNKTKTIKVDEDGLESIMFVRLYTGERMRLRLYSKSGQMISKSVQSLSYLARDKHGEQKVNRLNFRLIKMIQLMAEHFPGKPIEIISGYRQQSESDGVESQHAFGRALDFRMPGVPPKSIFKFCKTFKHAGCGYYPSDGFVHMDARERSAFWIDRSKGRSQ